MIVYLVSTDLCQISKQSFIIFLKSSLKVISILISVAIWNIFRINDANDAVLQQYRIHFLHFSLLQQF